jgi:uncharacterized protein
VQTLSVLWRRLDTSGHDACRVTPTSHGWELDGTAVFDQRGAPARLGYELQCDSAWRSVRGRVHGFVGPNAFDFVILRTDDGGWTVGGRPVPGLESLVHLDFGFTPATNLPQLQQLSLAVGQRARLPVAWIDIPPNELVVLEQFYELRSATTCWYESPSTGYAALLELTSDGLVRRYPGLWELER